MITAFWHIGPVGCWREVAAEQLRLLGAASFPGQIYCHYGGPDEHRGFIQRVADVHGLPIEFLLSSPRRNESPCLEAAQRFAHDCAADMSILYFHTKGITHPGDWHVTMWRWAMNAVMLTGWEEAEKELVTGGWDFVAPQVFGGETPHSSGNYWLATSAHLRRLETFQDYYRGFLKRYAGRMPHGWHQQHADEAWIGSSYPDLKCHQLLTLPVTLWSYTSWCDNVEAQTWATRFGS